MIRKESNQICLQYYLTSGLQSWKVLYIALNFPSLNFALCQLEIALLIFEFTFIPILLKSLKYVEYFLLTFESPKVKERKGWK